MGTPEPHYTIQAALHAASEELYRSFAYRDPMLAKLNEPYFSELLEACGARGPFPTLGMDYQTALGTIRVECSNCLGAAVGVLYSGEHSVILDPYVLGPLTKLIQSKEESPQSKDLQDRLSELWGEDELATDPAPGGDDAGQKLTPQEFARGIEAMKSWRY